MQQSSRRAFLKSSAGAAVAGGALLSARLAEAVEAPRSPNPSPASPEAFRPAETNAPQAQYPRVDPHSRRVQFRIDAPRARRVQKAASRPSM